MSTSPVLATASIGIPNTCPPASTIMMRSIAMFQWQIEADGVSVANAARRGDAPTDLFDGVAHDVHADAAARDLSDTASAVEKPAAKIRSTTCWSCDTDNSFTAGSSRLSKARRRTISKDAAAVVDYLDDETIAGAESP